jgi:hypothetical protein
MDDDAEMRLSVGGGGRKRPSKGNFRSSIYGGAVRRQSQFGGKGGVAVGGSGLEKGANAGGGWENTGAPPVVSKYPNDGTNARKDHRRQSITENGKKLARRASSIIAHPMVALGEMVEASMQTSVIGAANSRAQQV